MEREEYLAYQREPPLMMPVVLEVIFDFMKVADLKRCREVCSLWNAEVLKSNNWKVSTLVRIETFKERRKTNMTDFFQLLETGDGNPFSRAFYLSDISVICVPFWTQCGASLNVLTLHNVNFQSVDEFRMRIYTGCPNMVQLTLENITVVGSRGMKEMEEPIGIGEPQLGEHKKLKFLKICQSEKGFGVTWMDFLAHFPKIETLELKNIVPSLDTVLTSLNKLRENSPSNWKLKHFVVSVVNPNDPSTVSAIIGFLTHPNLHMETIDLNISLRAQELKGILELHAGSLKKLCLNGLRPISDLCKIFPLKTLQGSLEALRELKISFTNFKSIPILKFTPNIRKLTIVDDMFGFAIPEINHTLMDDIAMPSLEELNTSFWITLHELKKFISWFPNVIRLSVNHLTNAHFQLICEGWPRLKILELEKRTTVDDSGFTGLDVEDVERINGNGDKSDWRPITVPRANLTTLKDLKILRMTGSPRPPSELGYCTAALGIQQLPKLEELLIKKFKLSGDIWERVNNRFPGILPPVLLSQYIARRLLQMM